MTEKKSEHDLPDDLNKMFSNFIKLKESYIKEQSLRQSMERTIKDLKEENKVVHEAEKSERNKLVVTRQLITQHQDNFSNLLFVKSRPIF
ncbi:hypothetical protein C0J52_08801 [Blattella germanica]|nr:hypothetical protein C0J52_08801 [Blattella germanica]